jgi:hypothetical protein
MLWVYAGIDILAAYKLAKEELPETSIDFSKIISDELPKAVTDYSDHHSSGHIFLGYIDPLLMLHPTDEAKLRRGFTQCTMSIVLSNPLILPLSWKNGTTRLRIIEGPQNADRTKIIDDGSTTHVQPEVEHGRTSTQVADKRNTDKGGKEGSPPKRRKQKRQDKEEKS